RRGEAVGVVGHPLEGGGELVGGRQGGDQDSDVGHLPGEVLRLGLRPGGGTAVLVLLGPVPGVLAVLGQEDERGGVGRLGGEGQVQEDERVGVEAQRGGDDVE